MKIEAGKYYRTRDGRKVKVLCTNAPGNMPVVGFIIEQGLTKVIAHEWYLNGGYSFNKLEVCDCDLLEEWVEPKKPRLMANAVYIYPDGHAELSCELCESLDDAIRLSPMFPDVRTIWPARDAEGRPIFYQASED